MAAPWEPVELASGAQTKPKESQASTLVRLTLQSGAELFQSPDGQGYLTVANGEHRETHPLRSRAARAWLTRLYYAEAGRAPNGASLADALAVLEGKALIDGARRDVFVRVAEHQADIYLDLGDDTWQAVRITARGWHLVPASEVPVRFVRHRGLEPLSVPTRGGSLATLRPFVNVSDDDDFVLLAAWLIFAFRPRGPYPVLWLTGEQGSCKSTVSRALRGLIDPNRAPLRAEPREPRDLAISASNAWVVAFDNISGLSPWLADALCRIATEGAFSTRALYTDAEEVIFNCQRAILLNGIDQASPRGDLVDRSIIVTLPAIPDTQRLAEDDYRREYDEARPGILGALLDAVAAGLAHQAHVSLDASPRMADFARFVTAAEAACPWPRGSFLAAYNGNRQGAVEALLDGDPVAQAVRVMAKPWRGSATELLKALADITPEAQRKGRHWPSHPRTLTNTLRRMAPALRRVGVAVMAGGRTGRARLIHIDEVAAASFASPPSQPGRTGANGHGLPAEADPMVTHRDARLDVGSPIPRPLDGSYDASDGGDAVDDGL